MILTLNLFILIVFSLFENLAIDICTNTQTFKENSCQYNKQNSKCNFHPVYLLCLKKKVSISRTNQVEITETLQ